MLDKLIDLLDAKYDVGWQIEVHRLVGTDRFPLRVVVAFCGDTVFDVTGFTLDHCAAQVLGQSGYVEKSA